MDSVETGLVEAMRVLLALKSYRKCDGVIIGG